MLTEFTHDLQRGLMFTQLSELDIKGWLQFNWDRKKARDILIEAFLRMKSIDFCPPTYLPAPDQLLLRIDPNDSFVSNNGRLRPRPDFALYRKSLQALEEAAYCALPSKLLT